VDTQAPTISIISPAGESMLTTYDPSIEVIGSAEDDLGVVSVVWFSDRAGMGPCAGTYAWTTGPITMLEGLNTIVITAADASDNARAVQLVVERIPTAVEELWPQTSQEFPGDDLTDEPDDGGTDDQGTDDADQADASALDDPPAMDPAAPIEPDAQQPIAPLDSTDDASESDDDASAVMAPTAGPRPPALCGALGYWAWAWLAAAARLVASIAPSRRRS